MSNDVDFMKDPDQWPQVKVLPLARGGYEVGFLFCPLGATCPEPVVYLANLFDVTERTPLSDFPQKSYASLEAITADGWRVD